MESTIWTCNFCKDGIPFPEINAGVYGAHFHLTCFNKMSAANLAWHLGIDDVGVNTSQSIYDNNDGVKLNSYVRDLPGNKHG